jgi:hypothetical protein
MTCVAEEGGRSSPGPCVGPLVMAPSSTVGNCVAILAVMRGGISQFISGFGIVIVAKGEVTTTNKMWVSLYETIMMDIFASNGWNFSN